MRVPTRTALLAVTGNAVLMGAAGVSAPLGWVLVPGVAGMSARPRVAVLVSGWAAVLVAVSVMLPIIPGHRGDGLSLTASAVCLSAVPLLAWARQHAETSRLAQVEAALPAVTTSTVGRAGTRVAMAVSRIPGEVAALVHTADGGARALVGMVMGHATDPARCAAWAEKTFEWAAAQPDLTLDDLPAVLEPVVHRWVGEGYLSVTLIEISDHGQVDTLRCGGPEIIAQPAVPDGHPAPGPVIADAGPGGIPLGLGAQPPSRRHLPGNARIAIVTAVYATAHYDDYLTAVERALAADTVEIAAVALLLAGDPSSPASMAGPALVLDAANGAQ
ncbi:hypothetical protein O7632_00280 [Solwaraspora sp. WMMD406]|uniref:hypothetical protein n=1 Tax=Solwaraspora sp. WMMD406 TaxID=3016095 RepID=UPI0024178D2C|nr:hypothetical protein [Solwaraspora sp. WMMD406]MDG4762559.1 hypothetical protein [Solwaraspora sp. WMMD406]